ncbi:MAG: hypothetical protein FJ319_00865 [SAR202 cluster bacterium]|nr:hypothetical protein [SAR202 cluster bacterium]
MPHPRLIYYQDAHHFHAKRLDPPVTLNMLRWPVDELLGTGVDALAFGLGYGDVYFHQSKVGRVVGQKQDVWTSFIDWRIMRMVKDTAAMGTDQVREVINRGKETGLKVFPSLKLQSCDKFGSDRCGILKWDHWQEVCLGEKDPNHPRYEWCYDYANRRVQDHKLDVLRELLEDYEPEGIELDFMFVPKFFRTGTEEKNIPVMNEFVGRVRELADRIGAKQGRRIPIEARVLDQRNANLKLGLDVEAWLKNKSVDLVVGQAAEQLVDTGTIDIRWLVDAARPAQAGAYFRPPRRIYDERVVLPSEDMYRALAQTLSVQGATGMYLGYLPWPFAEREYQVLREMAHPSALVLREKRYLAQPREPGMTFEEMLDYGGEFGTIKRQAEDEITEPPRRVLPVQLEEGKTALVPIVVSDDVDAARKNGEMRSPQLSVRFSDFCVEDEIEIRFNGRVMARSEAEVTDERALQMKIKPRTSPLFAPLRMAAHWFRYSLPIDILKQGENVLEVTVVKMSKSAGFARYINGVEVLTRYKEFIRPESLKQERVEPVSG